jgi:hypothetical protein
MAIIVTETADKLTIDTSKAARVSPYTRFQIDDQIPSLEHRVPEELARGAVLLNFQSAGAIIGSPVNLWGFRNTSTIRIIRVHRIYFQFWSEQTGSASALERMAFNKAINVTAMSGDGTAATPSIFKTSLGQGTAFQVAQAQFTTLTLTGATFVGEFGRIRWTYVLPQSAQVASEQYSVMKYGLPYDEPIELAQNEVLVLQSPSNVGGSLSFFGSVFFTEVAK